MNKKSKAVVLSLGLMALAALPVSSFAADPAPAKKPAATKQEAHEHEEMECGGMMGHGMMGGGMGMMGGHGMMGGMMGGMMDSPRMHMVMQLDLSDDQRAKINKLYDDLHHRNWETQGKIMDEAAKLRDLYEADKRDPKAISGEYQKVFDMKRQMIEAMVDTQNHVEELLTPAQLAKLKEMRHKMGEMHEQMMHDGMGGMGGHGKGAEAHEHK
jgi:Spy/CpxP family protein refolding chaperone